MTVLPDTKEAAMHIELDCSTLTLPVNGLLTLEDGTGTRIECRSGALWITQEGEARDWVVGPADALTIRRGRRTIVSALESSSFTLIGPSVVANRAIAPG